MHWLRTRWRASAHDERGFTLVDVVAAFTLTGIVIAPLAVMLNEGMTAIPAAGARSVNSSNRDRFQAAMQTDLSQAGQFVVEPSRDASGNTTGTPTIAFQALPGNWVQASSVSLNTCVTTASTVQEPFFDTGTWDASTTPPYITPAGVTPANTNVESQNWAMVRYALLFRAPRQDGFIPVEVHRLTTTWDRSTAAPSYPAADSSNLYVSGFCKPGDWVTFLGGAPPNTTNMHEVATILVQLRDSPSDALVTTNATTAIRDRCDTC
jgi:hypothetical protein